MSGVAVCWYLAKTNPGVLGAVAAANIMGGEIPLGTDLPAIGMEKIDGVERVTVDMQGRKMVIERVQISVQAKTYSAAKAILELVVAALPLSRGTVNGILVDSILPDIEGPDFSDSIAEIYVQSKDFIVRWYR